MSVRLDTWPAEVTLTGNHARLEPLGQAHSADLSDAAQELGQLWYTMIPTPEGVPTEIARRCALQEAGSMLPFAIMDLALGKAIGMTTYMNIDAVNARVEIGSTWLATSVQRGPINTECKLLLLGHAFEVLGCIAVEFRTHFMNLQSRRAIERLGAKQDGVLRNHMKMANGTLRDTAVYSILNSEWPAVRANLQGRLA